MRKLLDCLWCGEPVLEHEPRRPGPLHENCFLCGVIGSVAHLQRRCACYVPGSQETGPPDITLR